MSASVDIQTAITSNVTSVPIEAVTIRSKSELDTTAHTSKKPQTKNGEAVSKKDEAEVVFILKDNKVSLRQVKTGIQDDKYIQITEGVSADEEIVTGPYSAISRTLKNGDEVTKVRKEELFEISKSGGSNE